MTEKRITDDLDKLLRVLPTPIVEALQQRDENHNLIEIVMDLGQVPTARYVAGEVVLLQTEISRKDLEMISRRLHFDADNRAGMERTLHRISAIRNRRGAVVGLTCRIGRAVYGTIDVIEDLIKSGQNLLMLGAPGVGKTTMLREAARVLAESKRVVIVDTSNEIAGDGDVAHPAIGQARRMQVSHPERQHEVMIEAVENHNPEVIIIDEIGRELEAQAARTIAERGVQLIGTAHGNTLENLMLNPTLSDLVGGIESVTLSDEEARRRGTQKVVLERRAPPTFDIMVEIQTRDRMAVHEDVATDVDGILRGRPQSVEMRVRDENGNIHREMQRPMIESRMFHDTTGAGGQDKPAQARGNGNNRAFGPTTQPPIRVKGNGNGQYLQPVPADEDDDDDLDVPMADIPLGSRANLKPITVYAYGVARNRLVQSARRLNVPLNVTDELDQSGAVVTLKSYYRNRPKMVVDAERRGMPIYVLRANTVSQIENFLVDVFKLEQREHDPFGAAMVEVEQAITRIRAGEDMVDLAPQASHIRRQQHIAARKAGITAISSGETDERYVRLIRDHIA